ncbi:hypothetical protein BKA63DRAFT_498742 [Paraphoma chrysanthemicola]|nr:hypothetical protein BKA63DRAFT_498742 [Paraphoma chrysanthemicola]
MTPFRRRCRRCRTETTYIVPFGFMLLPLLSPVRFGAGMLGRFGLGTWGAWGVVHGGIMLWGSISEVWAFAGLAP